MIRARIAIDLPSAETDRPMGASDWLRSVFGSPVDLGTGYEELTISALWLVQGLRRGFVAAGVTDALSLLVDGDVVYADDQQVPDDLDQMLGVAKTSGVLERTFQEMRLVMRAQRGGLHLLFDLAVQRKVMLGEAELALDVSARPDALTVRAGETAAAYAARVRAFAQRGELAGLRREFDSFVADLAAEFATLLAGAAVSAGPTRIDVLRPDISQVALFRVLPFGNSVRAPSWRPVPQGRRDPDEDPFHLYTYDPYWSLTSWLLCDAYARGLCPPDRSVGIVDVHGERLGHAEPAVVSAGWDTAAAVSLDDRVRVDGSVPEARWDAGDR
jgi:hypothetical protein